MRIIKKIKPSHLLVSFFSLGLFLIDRFFKIIAIGHHWSRLGYYENTGIAFSLAISRPYLAVILIGVLAWFIYEYSRQRHHCDPLFELGFYLVIGGLFSNLLDRLLYGFVVDYFALDTGLIFNLADMMILVGALIFGIKLYLYEKK